MIGQPDFTGVRVKVERAKHHFRDLQARYERYQEVERYRVAEYDEADTGDLVRRFEVTEQPPPLWGAIAGDCVHNLRSSLDLLVCEMVRANDRPVTPDTAFYIAKSADAFRSGYNGKIQGTPKCAVDLIKKAEPYQGADNPFWRLHQLDIADKHKLLVPVGVAHKGTTNRFSLADVLNAYPDENTINLFDMPTAEGIGIIVPKLTFPLEEWEEGEDRSGDSEGEDQ